MSLADSLLPEPRPRRSPPAGRRSRTRSYTHRRRAGAREVAAPPLDLGLRLREFWDEHAVKAGMLGFCLWFTAANWGSVTAAFH